ncbi:purine permease 18 [Hirschfeldia incana]|nr:purine permease 18 [Hirschfeldia incana]
MEMSEASKQTTRSEPEQVQNQEEPDQILSRRRSMVPLNQKKWWISVSLCIFLVFLGDSLVALLLNFFYVQDNRKYSNQDPLHKGTWTQALIQNAAFPVLIPLLFIFPSPKQNPETSSNTRFLSFRILFLYFSLGVLVAAHSKLFAVGKLYANYGIFTLISVTQLIFTAIFTAVINRFKFDRWIVISIILTLVVYLFGGPAFGGAPAKNEQFYYSALQAWATFAGSVAFALSLCLFQLGFEKLLVKTKRYGNSKVFRMVLEMQICVSFVASVVCLVCLFVSGEYKELKGEGEMFKKGEAYYVLTMVGLALSWQVWAVGLIGSVFYVSGVFGDVVHMCASPLVALVVVLAFDFKGDEFSWPGIAALVGTALALGSYFCSAHKKNKEVMELNQRENDGEV